MTALHLTASLAHGQRLLDDGRLQPVGQPHPRSLRPGTSHRAAGRARALAASLVGCATPAEASRQPGLCRPDHRLQAGAAFSTADKVVVPEGYTATPIAPWATWSASPGACRPSSSTPATPPRRGAADGHAPRRAALLRARRLAPRPAGDQPGVHRRRPAARRWAETWTLAEKVRKAQASHGITAIEVELKDDRWQCRARATPAASANTPFAIGGPAAGHPLMKTAADPAGRPGAGHR